MKRVTRWLCVAAAGLMAMCGGLLAGCGGRTSGGGKDDDVTL